MQLFKLIVITLLISSCSVQQKANRKIKWLKEHNYLTTKRDTIRDTIQEYRDTGSTKLVIEYDSIDNWYAKDTCFTKGRVNRILSIVKIDTVDVDNERIELKIWIDKGEIKYNYNVKPVVVEKEIEIPILKDCPPKPWWDKWYVGSIGTLLAFILLFFIFSKRE